MSFKRRVKDRYGDEMIVLTYGQSIFVEPALASSTSGMDYTVDQIDQLIAALQEAKAHVLANGEQ